MAKLINYGLTDLMLRYEGALLFGEDVAQKGGVYNVTEGLLKKFGEERVYNTLLDEQTIIGQAIGLAHNGFLPIAEIQFLAYFHNAEDQIRGEAATLPFFSQGQYTNPMILRIAGLAYQKGFGGHFHNDNSIAIFRDIPGLIIAVPSRGDDAVQMLRTCAKEAYENGRVVMFIEPIALYMTKDLHQVNDKQWSFPYPESAKMISLGEFGVYGEGTDLAIITFGNGTFYSLQAQKELTEKYGLQSRIIDLRWISPIDEEALVEAVQDCEHILIVDECRKTGSTSEFLLSMLATHLEKLPPVSVLAALDCFIPLGVAAAAGLPKKAEIVQAAVELTARNRKLQ
jgi:2-oxoisovalerate dehydrogenase E1 component